MITHDISYNKILACVRETSGTDQVSLLERKDIENIAREYEFAHIQHPEDSISVQLLVQELKKANELLYFKDQGVIDTDNSNIDEKEFALGIMKWARALLLQPVAQ